MGILKSLLTRAIANDLARQHRKPRNGLARLLHITGGWRYSLYGEVDVEELAAAALTSLRDAGYRITNWAPGSPPVIIDQRTGYAEVSSSRLYDAGFRAGRDAGLAEGRHAGRLEVEREIADARAGHLHRGKRRVVRLD